MTLRMDFDLFPPFARTSMTPVFALARMVARRRGGHRGSRDLRIAVHRGAYLASKPPMNRVSGSPAPWGVYGTGGGQPDSGRTADLVDANDERLEGAVDALGMDSDHASTTATSENEHCDAR